MFSPLRQYCPKHHRILTVLYERRMSSWTPPFSCKPVLPHHLCQLRRSHHIWPMGPVCGLPSLALLCVRLQHRHQRSPGHRHFAQALHLEGLNLLSLVRLATRRKWCMLIAVSVAHLTISQVRPVFHSCLAALCLFSLSHFTNTHCTRAKPCLDTH